MHASAPGYDESTSRPRYSHAVPIRRAGAEVPMVYRGKGARMAGLAVTATVTLGAFALAGQGGAAASTHAASAARARPPGGLTVVAPAVVPPPKSTDLGAAPAAAKVHFAVELRPKDPAALSAFATAVSTPGSALYRHYLAKGQAAELFGPTPATVNKVRTALAALGLTPGRTTADRVLIPVTASTARIDSALRTSMHAFRLSGGAVAYANITPLRLPAGIAAAVQAIVGLDGLFRETASLAPGTRPSHRLAAAAGVAGQAEPCAKASAAGLTGPQIAQAYDMDPLYNEGDFGQGQNADLVELAPFSSSDIGTYQKCYGTHVRVNTIVVESGLGSDAAEDEVDIEDLISLAPRLSNINVYEAPANTPSTSADVAYGQVAIENTIMEADNARVISDSWGGCETQAGNEEAAAAEEPILAMIASQGQDFFAAAGDSGSQACTAGVLNVADPASQPWVTAVGGTNLNGVGDPPAFAPSETAWSAGGGGISSNWQMPIWQFIGTLGVVNKYSTGAPCKAPPGIYCREVPDVSANAGVSYGMITGNGKWGPWVGTSIASPTWAAAVALINASSPACVKNPVGFINTALYALAIGPGIYLNDITKGNDANGHASVHGKYPATKGYDLATGLGTPEAANLAWGLCGTSPLWSPETTFAGSYNSGVAPAIAASGHTLYMVTTSSAGDIFYQTFNGAALASTEVRIGKSPVKTAFSAAIAINDGKPAIAWTASSGAVEVATLSGGKWSAAVVVGRGKALSSRGPALTAGGGFLNVAWKGKSTGNVYISLDTSKGWSAQLKVPGASTSDHPALVYYPPASNIVIAWTTSKNTIKYENLSAFGFGTIATVPQAGTNASPALTVVGTRLYVAWKGRTTDKIFYKWQPDKKLYGTWSGQLAETAALTREAPSIAASGQTLYTAWLGTSGKHLWYQFADVPN
jgi:Pro-kumamolisin, activation domain